MRISEVAALSGLSVDTIRFYERSKLLPDIDRDKSGKRCFTAANVDWLILLASLRATGMPMEKMRHFAELYRIGDAAIPQRREILVEHADHLENRRAEIDRCALLLKHKIETYFKIEGA